jgi:hypothetical protein
LVVGPVVRGYREGVSDVPLVRLLSMAVTVALEELHAELHDRGHGSLRPAHGYALNGMTKQGAAKLVQTLIEEGYLAIDDAGEDARRKPLRLTDKGQDAVRVSVEIQDRIEGEWADLVGPRRMSSTRTALERAVTNAVDGGYPPVRLG